MKKALIALFVLSVLVISIGIVMAAKPTEFDSNGVEKGWEKQDGCTTIQDGTLVDSNGDQLVLGFDKWGYNYQAHMFRGPYCYYDRHYDPEDPDWNDNDVYCDIDLQMNWNDAWLSNKDCDGDGKLDRHYGFDSYIGSGAWLTNHMRGDGWTYFVKIVAKPTADYKCNYPIWGPFCIIQEVSSGAGATIYETPGLGNW